ncbi:zinc-dependent metalloprotease family protein [Luminiphilus sp.]|nr:zinc-dependent metalloprotease family protein [Luminiphilus sp.]
MSTASGTDYRIDIARVSRSFHGNLLLSGATSSSGKFVLVVKPTGEIYGSLESEKNFYLLTSLSGSASIEPRDANFSPLPYDGALYEPEDTTEYKQVDISELNLSQDLTSAFAAANFPTYRSGKAVIDVLIYLDSNLEDPEATLDYVVEFGNYALELVDVKTEVRVVHAAPVAMPVDVTNGDILNFLASDRDVAADRAEFSADLVHAIRATTSNTVNSGNCGVAYYTVKAGLGYRGDADAVGVTQWSDQRLCFPETFIHEIGHNLGSAHNREQCTGLFGCNTPAYSYSYGKLQAGVFGTIMAYRDFDVDDLYSFSTPDYICDGYPCGEPTSSNQAADNRRSILNTRFLVAGYEGDDFLFESIQESADSDACSSNIFDTFEGISFRNSSPFSVGIRGVTFLRANGSEYASSTFERGEYVVSPGGSTLWGWCNGPVGQEVREGYFFYEHPKTRALIEGQHVLFDDNYRGVYWTVRAAAGDGGAVVGNPSVAVKDGRNETIGFKPDGGFKLSGVTGTCDGSVQGNDVVVENTSGDCTVIAQFSPRASNQVFKTFDALLTSVTNLFGASGNEREEPVAQGKSSSNEREKAGGATAIPALPPNALWLLICALGVLAARYAQRGK